MKAYGTMILTGLICAFLVGASFFYQRSVERDLTGRVNRAINHQAATGLKISWLDVILERGSKGTDAAVADSVPEARILEHHDGVIEKALVHDLEDPVVSLPADSQDNAASAPSLNGIAIDYAEDEQAQVSTPLPALIDNAQSLRFTRIGGELNCFGILPDQELRTTVETLASSLDGISGDITHQLIIAPEEARGWWWESLEDFVPKYFESVTGNSVLQCSMQGLIAQGKLREGVSAALIDQLLRVAAPATGEVEIDLDVTISLAEPPPVTPIGAAPKTDNAEIPVAPSPGAPLVPAKLSTEIVGDPISFGANFAGVEKAEKAKIIHAATQLKDLGEGVRAIIKGYSDYEGNSNYRKNLAHQRAENVKILLIESGLPASAFTVVTEETDPGGGDDSQSSRRVEILKIVERKTTVDSPKE